MAQNKHLHELLREDQEPFHLRDYISDRKTQMQLRKRKPISDPPSSTLLSSFPRHLCKTACFPSFHDSPDFVRSPAFSKSPNPIFLHVPSRTAAVLLDAAARIQRRPKTRDAKSGLGLLGSVLKKLTHRNRGKNRETAGVRVPAAKDQRLSDKEFSCSCDGRHSSAVWSESNEERSLDLDTSPSSSGSSGGDSTEFGPFERLNGVFASSEDGFCESPFRFVLQGSPSPSRRTPVSTSFPASRRHDEEKVGYEEKEEEEKEQCSPVSVLEPPLNYEDAFDLECSFAFVQRTKQQLLQKLLRFEKLAELDLVELERKLEESDEDGETQDQDERRWGGRGSSRIPADMKRLVSDLIAEESEELRGCSEGEAVSRRVRKRLEDWEEVESNTIDMMVGMDFGREADGWKRSQDQVGNVAMEIERAIFGLLVEELSEEMA